jgi:hypothetical protein
MNLLFVTSVWAIAVATLINTSIAHVVAIEFANEVSLLIRNIGPDKSPGMTRRKSARFLQKS